jgi:hypothetical protein
MRMRIAGNAKICGPGLNFGIIRVRIRGDVGDGRLGYIRGSLLSLNVRGYHRVRMKRASEFHIHTLRLDMFRVLEAGLWGARMCVTSIVLVGKRGKKISIYRCPH